MTAEILFFDGTPEQKAEKCYEELNNATTSYSRQKWSNNLMELWQEYPTVKAMFDYCDKARKLVDRWIRKAVKKIAQVFSFGGRKSKYDEFITLCVPVQRKVECAYGLHIVNHHTGEIIASKVGTTKDIATRMRDEIVGYTESYGQQVGIRVVRFAEYNSHAETIADESFFRFALICRYPELFKDNDRFNTIEIPAEELEEIANAMEMAKKSLSRG